MLPPSATSASAMVLSALVVSALVLAVAYDGDPDAGKGRRDRGMRLVHGDPYPQNLREPLEDGFGDRAGRGLDQPTPAGAERPARGPNDLVITPGMRGPVRARNPGRVQGEHPVRLSRLSPPCPRLP